MHVTSTVDGSRPAALAPAAISPRAHRTYSGGHVGVQHDAVGHFAREPEGLRADGGAR